MAIKLEQKVPEGSSALLEFHLFDYDKETPILRSQLTTATMDLKDRSTGDVINSRSAVNVTTDLDATNVTGTAQGGGQAAGGVEAYITVSSGAITSSNLYKDYTISTTGGTGKGQFMKIIRTDDSNDRVHVVASDNGKRLGRTNDWDVVPDNTTTYAISSGKFSRELVAADNPISDATSPAEETHIAVFNFVATVGSLTITARRTFLITVINQEQIT